MVLSFVSTVSSCLVPIICSDCWKSRVIILNNEPFKTIHNVDAPTIATAALVIAAWLCAAAEVSVPVLSIIHMKMAEVRRLKGCLSTNETLEHSRLRVPAYYSRAKLARLNFWYYKHLRVRDLEITKTT